MQATSNRFKLAISQSHVMRTKIDVYQAGTLIYEDLPISEGNVSIDDTAIRTSGNITLHLEEVHPIEQNRLLFPGNTYTVERGLVFPDGTEELIRLGTLMLVDTRVDDSGNGYNIRIDAKDYAHEVSKSKLASATSIAAGTNTVEAIRTLLNNNAPWVVQEFVESDETCSKMVLTEGSDVWAACLKLAKTIGFDLFFDPYGVCKLQPAVTDLSTPVWTYKDDDDSMFMYINSAYSEGEALSQLTVTGESTDNTALAAHTAFDTDPQSPTYIGGQFGRRSRTIISSQVANNDQAAAYAEMELSKSKGIPVHLQLLSIVNPAHELGDVVRIERDKFSQVSLDIIDKITVPLVPIRGQNLSMRQRRIL